MTVNDSNVGYLTINDHLKLYRINNLRNLTINNKLSKMPILRDINPNSQTCVVDAITFDGSMNSLEVTLTCAITSSSSKFPSQNGWGVLIFCPSF